MANRRREAAARGRILEMVVSAAGGAVALTGIWLWWFGESESLFASSIARDQMWVRRVHVAAAVALATAILFMAARAAARNERWRLIFLVVFGVFLALGFWAGFTADWDGARLWATTVGSKISAGLNVDNSPSLPDSLQRARLHLSIIPASLLVVVLVSFIYDRNT